MKYIRPKIGDKIICINDDSQNEDLGMSGIVLKGTKGLNVGEKYEVHDIDISRVPKRINPQGYAVWTQEEYQQVKWYWTTVLVEGKGFRGWTFLGYFKRE